MPDASEPPATVTAPMARRSIAGGAAVVLAGLALSSGALASAPARRFDAPGQEHASVCRHLTSSRAALRFGDGSPTGFSVSGRDTASRDQCPRGTIRLDLHEVLASPRGPLVFHRGGFHTSAVNAKYGEVRVADIAGPLPVPDPAGDRRGAPCPLADAGPYAVRVRAIPDAMHYKTPEDVPNDSNRGASFMHYGDPGQQQGSRRGSPYTYLLWSFLDVRGGGMVRTLLSPSQVVRKCAVGKLTMPAWSARGVVNGTVTARYVRVEEGGHALYGWMVWSHAYRGETPVMHALPLE